MFKKNKERYLLNIYQALLAALPPESVPVRNIVVGVHWTMVCSKYCGLASTLVNCGPHGNSKVRDVGALQQRSVQELAQWILSDNLLEASIGMAALNSLVDVQEKYLSQVNAADVIAEKGRGKNVVIVGHFPFVDQIRGVLKNCWVIEKRPFGDDFPEEAAEDYFPKADVIAITGTAFINHTMEKLLGLCPPTSLVMILGPSTPLTPLLFDYGVSFLSGARVDDEISAVHTITQGASLPQVKGIRLMTMSRNGAAG
jgi:uncharacterized protein (DUF4213/DUF364 family)